MARKLIAITRHGEKQPKPNDNFLTLESLSRMYNDTGTAIREVADEYDVDYAPETSLLTHSEMPRTRRTGRCILAGTNQIPVTPLTNESLDELVIPGLTEKEDKLVGFSDLKYNADVWKASEADYMARWIGNPDATEMDDVEITSFNDWKAMRGELLTKLVRETLKSENKDGKPYNLGFISSHGGVADAFAAALIDSGRATSGEKIEDYGGMFEQEGYALLALDTDSSSATLLRNGDAYPVDLNRFEEMYARE